MCVKEAGISCTWNIFSGSWRNGHLVLNILKVDLKIRSYPLHGLPRQEAEP